VYATRTRKRAENRRCGGSRGAGIGKPGHGKHPGTRGARPTRSSVLARKNNKMIFPLPVRTLDARPPAAADCRDAAAPSDHDGRTDACPGDAAHRGAGRAFDDPDELAARKHRHAAWSCRATSTAPRTNVTEDQSTPLQPTEMDARIAVPLGAAPPETIERPLTLIRPGGSRHFHHRGSESCPAEEKRGKAKWQLIVRILFVAFHAPADCSDFLASKTVPFAWPTPEQ